MKAKEGARVGFQGMLRAPRGKGHSLITTFGPRCLDRFFDGAAS